MDKVNFTPFPDLATERLYLRQIADEDMDEFFILKSDERLVKGYDAKPRTYEGARLKLQQLNNDIAGNESITWGITIKDENKVIGSICLWNISETQSKAEIGYELMFDWQGRGIMQEAAKSVIEYGFKVMKLQLIEAVPNPNNLKSVRLLEKLGFTKGANFYENDQHSGRVLERVTYSLYTNLPFNLFKHQGESHDKL